ncbi:hypothetical protein ALI22I_22225 [Saccharothrix sp. ALI-22-I]|uniref:hypothetical protein n=1 Tax=Saccharothrix sp. ALI-22-I TaxID=1933778 RepID=UPI00097C8A01|nr:hypothetical protein [Saccharothrix sp. ALI-22-I]ONI87177.1 hypothetical protein ALI22I_22225 [Saccharothrix sp. ALI-22-I]
MTDKDVPQGDAEQEPQEQEETAAPLNRAARRGHANKNDSVNKVPGRPHQNTFVGRRVFRRTSGG